MDLATLRTDMEVKARGMLADHFSLQDSLNDGRIVPVANGRSGTINRINSVFQRDYRLTTGEKRTPLRPVLVEIVDGAAKELGYELKPVFWKRDEGYSESPYHQGQHPIGNYWVKAS